MHRVLKYVYESFYTLLYIIGTVLIIFITLLAFNLFTEHYTSTPKTVQGIVVAKSIKESKIPLKDDSYHILIKTDDNKLENLLISKSEFNRIENEKQYIFQIKYDEALYAISTTQNEFLKENNISKANISVSDDNIQTALDLGYEVDENLVAINDNDNNDDVSNDKKNNDTDSENKLDENTDISDKNDEEEQPVDNEDTNTENENQSDNTQSDNFEGKREVLQRVIKIEQGKTKEITIDTELTNYEVGLFYEDKNISCKNLPSDRGQCSLDENKIILKDYVGSGTFLVLKIFHDTAKSDAFYVQH